MASNSYKDLVDAGIFKESEVLKQFMGLDVISSPLVPRNTAYLYPQYKMPKRPITIEEVIGSVQHFKSNAAFQQFIREQHKDLELEERTRPILTKVGDVEGRVQSLQKSMDSQLAPIENKIDTVESCLSNQAGATMRLQEELEAARSEIRECIYEARMAQQNAAATQTSVETSDERLTILIGAFMVVLLLTIAILTGVAVLCFS